MIKEIRIQKTTANQADFQRLILLRGKQFNESYFLLQNVKLRVRVPFVEGPVRRRAKVIDDSVAGRRVLHALPRLDAGIYSLALLPFIQCAEPLISLAPLVRAARAAREVEKRKKNEGS